MAGLLKRLFSRTASPAPHPAEPPRAPVIIPDPYARLDLQKLFGLDNEPAPKSTCTLEKGLVRMLRRETERALTLPRQPSVLPQLIRWLNDDSVSHRELARTIEQDPALSAELLRLANSVWFRVGPDPVESLPRAVTVVGLNGLRRLVAAALSMPVIRGQAPDREREALWHWALTAGTLSRDVARYTRVDEATLYLATLVMPLGYLTLYLNARTLGRSSNIPDPQIRSQMPPLIMRYRFDIARRIADHWHLPADIRNSLRELGRDAPRQPGTLAHALAITLQCAHLHHLYQSGHVDRDEVQRFCAAQTDPSWYDTLLTLAPSENY